jgi:hypothetical protein
MSLLSACILKRSNLIRGQLAGAALDGKLQGDAPQGVTARHALVMGSKLSTGSIRFFLFP